MIQTKKVSDAILLYRIEDGLDEDGVSLVMRRFVEVKKTPTGRWVCRFESAHTLKEFGGWVKFADARASKHVRWVSSNAVRSLCYEDFKVALNSYMRRKVRQEIFARTALETSELATANKDKIMALSQDDFTQSTFPRFLLGEIGVMERYIFD